MHSDTESSGSEERRNIGGRFINSEYMKFLLDIPHIPSGIYAYYSNSLLVSLPLWS